MGDLNLDFKQIVQDYLYTAHLVGLLIREKHETRWRTDEQTQTTLAHEGHKIKIAVHSATWWPVYLTTLHVHISWRLYIYLVVLCQSIDVLGALEITNIANLVVSFVYARSRHSIFVYRAQMFQFFF